MKGDYKYEIACKADDIAQERYGKAYEDLSQELQLVIFDEAGTSYFENLQCQRDIIAEGIR